MQFKSIISYFRCAMLASPVLKGPRVEQFIIELEKEPSCTSLISIHIINLSFLSSWLLHGNTMLNCFNHGTYWVPFVYIVVEVTSETRILSQFNKELFPSRAI
jgi:hypothetical protein